MTERPAPQSDGEAATCHVCGQTFDTQLELSEHLKDMHPDDVLGPAVVRMLREREQPQPRLD